MTKPWERDWGGGTQPKSDKKPWERDDLTSQMEGAASMGQQAQDGFSKTLLETLKDVGYQGGVGPMEGVLKSPGALFGDMPLWLVHKGMQAADRLRRMNAEDQGKPAPPKLAREDFAEVVRDYPIGSNSVRTMERDLLGIPDPAAPKTGAGRYVRSGGEFLGGAVATGPASLANYGRSFLGGVGFEAGRDMAPESEVIPLLTALGASSAPGAALGTARALVPRIDPKRAADARFLMSRGVPVYPGQAASNSFIQNLYDMARKTSLFGNNAAERQAGAFTRAAARTMGANTDDVTQGVMDATTRRNAASLERLYGQSTVDMDAQLANDISGVVTDARRALQDRQFGYINTAAREAAETLASGPVNGTVYWNLIKKDALSALNNALNSQDPTVAGYAARLRNAMEGALDRASPGGVRPLLTAAKARYANQETLRPLALRSATDDISPAGLLNRVAHTTGHVRGELGRLGKAGKNVLKPVPSSGTAERLFGTTMVSSLGGTAAGLAAGTVGAPVVMGALAGASIPMGTRALLESQWLMRAMLNKAARNSTALGRPRPPTSLAPAANAATQAVSALQRPPFGPQWSSGGLLTY